MTDQLVTALLLGACAAVVAGLVALLGWQRRTRRP